MLLINYTLAIAGLLRSIISASILAIDGSSYLRRANDGLQDLVTWDSHSIKVRGERLMIYSGELHPFRLPVPGLWLDVFQKIKAMGFNCGSFYVYWGLLEAATEAGIYLVARPGPYINAETAAGGFPGWTLRINATLRSYSPEYLNATNLYASTIGEVIANAQITNGGPVVLFQPENEYSTFPGLNKTTFPDYMSREYMAYVEKQFRDAGIVVPFIVNDNQVQGYFAPGTGLGAVNIYGIDAYPLRYDCAHPSVWPIYEFVKDYEVVHQRTSPKTPFAIAEFQGGAGTGWGGVNQDGCNALINEEAVRVVYKNNYGFGLKLFNIYMTYGGTNWGNLGYMGGDTSYDYGAAITEDRHVWREKYSEEKLEANFLKVSPAYLTAVPGVGKNGSHVNTNAIAVTPLLGTENGTNFYVVRHANFTSEAVTTYRVTAHTSVGRLTMPLLGGHLTLNGRDSKFHVTDYDIGGVNMIYSTAEIFTWAKSNAGRRVVLLYGGDGETHGFAFEAGVGQPVMMEPRTKILKQGSITVVQWTVTAAAQVIQYKNLDLYLLWRNDVYNYWSLELEGAAPFGNYSSPSKSSVILKAGYLLRTATIAGTALHLTGDINKTTDVELIYEPTDTVTSLTFNGQVLDTTVAKSGSLTATLIFDEPSLDLPDFSTVEWKMIDSLPEIQISYNDELWTVCNHKISTNPIALETPMSLYASDYGYHAGSLLYRGHFVASGQETTFFVNTTGGTGYGHSVWLNSTFLGSWTSNFSMFHAQTLSFPSVLQAKENYVITILIDHMGQDEEAPGTDAVKFPRGLLSYSLSAHPQADVTWKMTGNPGGEQYKDQARGPRNEGAMYAERQGFHLPMPPNSAWNVSSPISNGISACGIGFYTTSFDLQMPLGYDLPLSFVFTNNTTGNTTSVTGQNYRVQLFVNGWQFGKYVSNLGPQTTYPIPEGILNYNGTNYLALTLWALDPQGTKLGGLALTPQMPVISGYSKPALSPQPVWTKRTGAY